MAYRQAVVDKKAKDIYLTTPTKGDYVNHAAKDFMNMLEAVAEAVPVPALSAAVKIALNIIKTCDESDAALQCAEELGDRIKKLVAVLVNELKGKRREEINVKIIEHIGALYQDLEYIERTLNKITSQHRLLLVFFRGLNESKIHDCITKVNNSLEAFNLARNIDHATSFAQLETKIRTFYDQQQRSANNLQVTMEDVKELLNERLPVNARPLPRASVPAQSAIFYGRDALLTEVISVITGGSRQHVCLLGPGGMGKTSLSLAVMGHHQVQVHFADHLRVWVPCVKATSIHLFLDILHSSLAVPKRTGNIEADIQSVLRASPRIIILLDNLETPWNVQGAQSEVERILRDIHRISHVTLFVTMRSSTPPCGDIPWYHINVPAVDITASHQIYEYWNPAGRGDPGLPQLFELIGNMPLATTLMAKVAKLTQLSAEKLMAEFKRLGTCMLVQGSDAESSLEKCIELSVESPRMRDHPEAFELLCIFALLPAGTTYSMLAEWWASDLSDLTGALHALSSTSLVEQHGSTFSVLPVIQHYILNPHRFHHRIRTSAIQTACEFLMHHHVKIGDPLYKEHTAALSAEEDNLEAVLLQVIASDPQIIREGLLSLAYHQQYNRPRINVIAHAHVLVPMNEKLLRGDILYCYGDIYYKLSQYEKSFKQFQAALDLFISVSDLKKSAETQLALNNVLIFHPNGSFDLRKQIIEAAERDFDLVDDKAGVARCLTYLGSLHRQHGSYDIALDLLLKAEDIFTKMKEQHRHAECMRLLAIAYYWSGKYDVAYSWATYALKEDQNLGDLTSCQLGEQRLGYIASARNDYHISLRHFLSCLRICKSMGLAPSGHALEGMGVAWAKLGMIADARKAFEEALQQSHSSKESTKKSQKSVLRIYFFLKLLERPELKPNFEELSALYELYTKDHIDRIVAMPFSN